ncbi:MAG: hypothetical protein GWO20_07885, partial [Candidatus Korarchaeota archaeon]|nr:hypothetical protein [Candidatus Korarchaeota archaeon]NIU83412.1 hypothetical protein [Candidatus Thorarchaeota archaeon]NIW13684.1 hypothetical protein [Candidatus Thorarchaeota archaeon]NIW51781.1 hypothetical protein [Candidatus Korarchaeota archaeon]
EGTESFTPWLEAGSKIGNQNKVKVCFLCMYEGKIRSLFLGEKVREVLYIFPQLNLGREHKKYWQRAMHHLVRKLEVEGIGVVKTWKAWAEIILEGKIDKKLEKLQAELKNKVENKRIKRIAESLKEIYVKVSNLRSAPWTNEVSFRGYTGLAKKIVEGKVDPPKPVLKRITQKLERASGEKFYQSPNFISVFLSREIKTRKESETSA